jgi:hypothetical protein
MANKDSWKEEAWEEFLKKFWDNRSEGNDVVEYSKDDLEPFLSKYKKSGQGEIRIFHYGSEKIKAVKKRNVAKLPLSRQRWKLILHTESVKFIEPEEEFIFQPKNELTDGMKVGIRDTMNQNTNPGETTLLAIANHSGVISDFYELGEPGILFTGGRQRAGIHLVVGTYDVDMTKAQIEIDGGFEWPNTVVIVEMKSSFNQEDFDINQALIPMLKWEKLLQHKKVHSLVLLAQTNNRGIEYWAYDLEHNKKGLSNEMNIVKSKKYILEIK